MDTSNLQEGLKSRWARLRLVAPLCLTTTAVLLLPILAAAPVASASPSMAAAPAKNCADTAIHGRLGLGINRQVNAGGPNFVSGVCKDINIKMTTNARFRTKARACLEPSDGGRLDCGQWVLLQHNKWQILRPDVAGGTRWQIQMLADSADTIAFDYTPAAGQSRTHPVTASSFIPGARRRSRSNRHPPALALHRPPRAGRTARRPPLAAPRMQPVHHQRRRERPRHQHNRPDRPCGCREPCHGV
jgi:hypothetical protein